MNGEQVKSDVVVSAFEWRSRRQDDVRMLRGFVDVAIDRHHELEARERAVQFAAVWRREHRVAGECHKRLHLPRSRSQYLFSQCRDRQLSGKLGQLSHATLPAIEMSARRYRFRRGY